MIKWIFLLNRQDDVSYDEFVDHWLDIHVPIALEMPHLVKYTTSLPTDPSNTPYDGVAELYYESEEKLERSVDSDEGEATLDNGGTFLDFGECLDFVVDEEIQLDEAMP